MTAKAADAARKRHLDLLGERDAYRSGAFYFSHLRSPIQTTETDGDGNFTMEIPQTGTFVIAAHGERSVVGDKPEQYYWLQPVSLNGRQQLVQNLSNSNFAPTAGLITQD